jgi:hypothetical protein
MTDLHELALSVARQTDKYWWDRETSLTCAKPNCGLKIRAGQVNITTLAGLIEEALKQVQRDAQVSQPPAVVSEMPKV